MKKTIIILLSTILLFGCKTKEVVKYINTESVRDSLVTVTVRDTLVKYLPQANAVFGVKKSYLKTDLAWSVAELDSCGLLNHSIQNFGVIPAKIITKDRFIRQNLKQKIYYNVTKTVTIKKKGFIYYLGLFTLFGAIIYLISYTIIKLKKKITI